VSVKWRPAYVAGGLTPAGHRGQEYHT